MICNDIMRNSEILLTHSIYHQRQNITKAGDLSISYSILCTSIICRFKLSSLPTNTLLHFSHLYSFWLVIFLWTVLTWCFSVSSLWYVLSHRSHLYNSILFSWTCLCLLSCWLWKNSLSQNRHRYNFGFNKWSALTCRFREELLINVLLQKSHFFSLYENHSYVFSSLPILWTICT